MSWSRSSTYTRRTPVADTLNCAFCQEPLDEVEAVWVDPDGNEGASWDDVKPYHEECIP